MTLDGRLVDRVRRSGHLGAALLNSTIHRPASPVKLNWCLTYWCQYRCKTCNIWQRKPTDELTTDEVVAFVRENPNITWADLTGGEIFLRPDIDEILNAVVTGWRRLALLHFPTNGFLTDRIVGSVERIAGRGPLMTVVTVSLDGDEATNDDVRGIKGGFRRQIETFKALRRIPGITAVLGDDAVGLQRGQVRGDVRGLCARVPRTHDRRRALERGAGLRPLLRQQRIGRHAPRCRCDQKRASRVPAPSRTLAVGRATAREHVPQLSRRVPADRTDADAVPCASVELLHRSLGCGVPVHHLLAPDRAVARHGHAPRADLESGRDPARAARDLGRAVPAVLDGVRGVPEHPRQRSRGPMRQPTDGERC